MIDGYSHCGLSKYRAVEDVLTVMRSAGVDRAVLCQHLGEYDNEYLAEVVASYPATFAAVCLVDPTSPSAVTDLVKWHATGRFRGIRLLAEWLRDYESLWARAVELDLTLVLFAPQGVAAAAPAIARFLAAHPHARIVITHLGNPQLRSGRLVETELLRLAAQAGVFVQLSGLSQFCDYPYAELHEFIRAIVREFGAPRIYWGSNFPVCGDDSAYRRDLRQVTSGEWDLTPEQIHWITGRTAEQLWFPTLPLHEHHRAWRAPTS
ncbi:MAG: amidohydrolase family protein [Pirellulaceae bacterium]